MRYKKQAEARMHTKPQTGQSHTDPTLQYRKALLNAHFASEARTEFMDDAYGDILVDLFIKWIETNPHEERTREYLYSVAQGLGFVREKMVAYELSGKNAEFLNQEKPEEETPDGT